MDSPHDPPCSRCRREAKGCFFSATRRRKKGAGDDDAGTDSIDGTNEAPYVARSGRKRLRASASAAPDQDGYEDEDYDEVPRTPGGSIGTTRPLRKPEVPKQPQYGEDDIKASEQTTAILQGAEVHGGHDALKVLYEAAVIRDRTGSTASNGRPSLGGPSPSSLPPATSPVIDKTGTTSYHTGPMGFYSNDQMWKTKLEPNLSKALSPERAPIDQAAYHTAVKAWSRFRFVRAGWFTAKEGIAYIDYFYKFLSPLTPVTLPEYRALEAQETLLTQEPMLAITILVIASRHMHLEGPGSLSRPYTIHQKLWTYLQGMIDRVVWGQEQFGGGFCSAGSQPGCDVNPLSRKGLRTLGTVESLMLLTEWHPRAMHFPPDEADDELMVPDEPFATPGSDTVDDAPKGIGGQRMDSWLEPCWRSDRMCWMLLGMAMSLAFEIGVFDKSEWQRHACSVNGEPLSAAELQLYDRRRGNVRDLLLVYVTLTSGRLGLTSMLPSNYSKPEDSDLYKRRIDEHSSVQETVLQFWLRIAAIMRDGNKKIFANKTFTRDLINDGSYKATLEQFRRPLADWRHDMDRCVAIPKFMRHVLDIEYEYCRVYLNALGLQAVAERCANDYPHLSAPPEHGRSAITTNGIRTDVAIAPHTLAKWLGGDRQYMIEVRDAACSLLSTVVDGLYPDKYLRHAPVRSYFRIISVAIMLLKSFSLGASEADVAGSLKLMDRTVEALRTCIVDDVHVASRFADLLETLTRNLRPRLKRIAVDGRSRRQSTHGTPHHNAEQVGVNGSSSNAHSFGQQPATPGALSAQQHLWGYNGVTPTESDLANPLFGISNDAYDLFGNNEYSIMPPPSFGLHSPSSTMRYHGGTSGAHVGRGAGGPSHHASGNVSSMPNYGSAEDGYTGGAAAFGSVDAQDWFALPLNPLLAMDGADVNQTMYGPELGGTDMLELLLK